MADLNFQIQHQSKDQWCWAAVASSICGFYRDQTVPTQCALAKQFLAVTEDCCQPDASDSCNVPFALDIVLNQLGHLVLPPHGIVSFEDLNSEISDNEQPVVARIMFSDFVTAHFVVVIGCAIDGNGVQVLKIADPSEVAGHITSIGYSAFTNDYRPGATWDQTYFTAKRA
jgi:hypothetical protein